MNPWLLLYTMVIFAADLVVFAVRFKAPPRWQPRLMRMMFALSTLAFAVLGATNVAAGVPAIGWSEIAVATLGTVLLPLRQKSDGHDRRDSLA